MNTLAKFGEPWATMQTQQAEGRINRKGQTII